MNVTLPAQSELKNVLSAHLSLDIQGKTDLADWCRMTWAIADIMVRDAPVRTPPGLLTDSEWFFQNTVKRTFYAVRETLARLVRSSGSAAFSQLGIEMAKSGLHIDDWAAKNALPISDDAAYYLRQYHIKHYGFPVVTNAAIDLMGDFMGRSGAILEVGAGTGYLACEMQARGLSVLPTDPMLGEGGWIFDDSALYTDVIPLDGRQAVAQYKGLDMVYSWPEMEAYPSQIIDGFTGRYLAYIGEEAHGCTGGAAFHRRLQSGRFELVAEAPLPRFRGIHDSLYIYENKHR